MIGGGEWWGQFEKEENQQLNNRILTILYVIEFENNNEKVENFFLKQ